MINIQKFNKSIKHDIFLYNASLSSQSHKDIPISCKEESLIHQNHHKTPVILFKDSEKDTFHEKLNQMNSLVQYNSDTRLKHDINNRYHNPFYTNNSTPQESTGPHFLTKQISTIKPLF